MKMNMDPNPEEKRRTPLTILSNLITMTKMKMRNQDEDVNESKMRNQIVSKMKTRTKTTMKNPIMFKMALSQYLDLTFQKFIKNFFVEEKNSFISF